MNDISPIVTGSLDRKKNVFGHQSVTRSGSFVNTLEVKRRQISGDLNIEILDFSSFDSITPQY